jgi:Zn-dependent protease with chaperone function
LERADFIHLVRLSEHASADDSVAYRRSVAIFAALGYLWVIGCFVLAIAILYWTVDAMTHGRFRAGYVGLIVAAAGLLWTSFRALWIRLEAPQGMELSRTDAPVLFEALERIRKKIKGPPIHHVLLDDSFNASITQLPRYGILGGAVNYLTIGLPLLLAIDRPRFLAVMAHEYGHLRGDHGQFAAWIYRTRASWMKMEHGMRNDSNPVAAATQAFLRWYFPRFLAKTFALARQDEYEADRIAGKLLGKEVAGAALTEIGIKGCWLNQEFWPLHWSGAAASAQPVGPFVAMRNLLALPVPADFARDTLRQNLRQISDVDDTHPALRDRLEALEVGKNLPAWSTKPALDLLGASGAKWMEHFDKQWCRDNATDWKLHHAYLSRVRARVDALTASAGRNNADEMTELGRLRKRLDASADVRACYERALQITPGHAGGLRGLVQCLPDAEQALQVQCLGQLFELSVANRWWACRVAVRRLEKVSADGSLDDKALKLWRGRLKDAEEAEGRAREEMTETPFFQSITRHDLSEFEKGEFESDMARCKPVVRAWLVRKNLREFANRRCYLLFIELPHMDDEDRYHLCRGLEQTLDLPGPVLALWAGYSPTLEDIRKNAFEPVYLRAGS